MECGHGAALQLLHVRPRPQGRPSPSFEPSSDPNPEPHPLIGKDILAHPDVQDNPKFKSLFSENDPEKIRRLNAQRRMAHAHPHVSYTNYHAVVERLFDEIHIDEDGNKQNVTGGVVGGLQGLGEVIVDQVSRQMELTPTLTLIGLHRRPGVASD